MNIIDSIIMQLIGLTPQYTKHPLFPCMLTNMIAAALIAIRMNIAFSLLRKKTTDIEKMNKVMKETNEWRKQYIDAIKKRDKARIEELKKKQAYVNKMSMEMQQQQMHPTLIYVTPSFMLWILVFASIFRQSGSLSPVEISWIMCGEQDLKTNTQLYEKGESKGGCSIREVFLWGWFLITLSAFSGIISKVTQTVMPSLG
jgi:uncharacterized membrane protein (DUF106 family)